MKRRALSPLTLVVVIAAMTAVPAANAGVTGDTSFTAPTTFAFTKDVLGANDVPGQKDLTGQATLLTADFYVAWKWDEIALSGGNTGDACALFETDSNGSADAALCVTIGGNPAVWKSTRVYTCGDAKPDRCTSTYTEVPSASVGSKCQVDNQAAKEFSAGAGGFDTQATCKVVLADLGVSSAAALLNTCSYPSREPTSAPSDCVLVPGVRQTGAIEITKVGDDASCTGTTLPATCQAAGTRLLSGAHFRITGTDVPAGATDLITGTNGKVCFAGLPTGNTYTVTETTAPSGYQIDDTGFDDPINPLGANTSKAVAVSSAGTCSAGATSVSFSDSPLSSFDVTFTPPAPGVTLAQISCSEGATAIAPDTADSTPAVRDDTSESYSGLTAGVYTCTIDIDP